MKPLASMRQALADPQLLGSILAGDRAGPAWRTMLIAMSGEPLEDDERKTFKRFTGREREPGERVQEAALIIGRRGGKDRAASVLATYVAGLCHHSHLLAPGERGLVLCIAADQRQAKVTLDYIAANFERSPILAQLVTNRTADSIELTNRIVIEVRAASFRRLRGMTCVAVIASEVAFWMDDQTSLNPDVEILNAVRPALSTTGGPLVLISTPYSRRGALWDVFNKHYGAKGDPQTLVALGTTRDFHPSFPQATIDRALEQDRPRYAAEYLVEWRSDLEEFIGREAIEACVDRGVFERAPVPLTTYFGFVDPSGGSGQDSMTLAVAHLEGDTVVLDAVRERKPRFNPFDVLEEFVEVLKSYRVTVVYGDRSMGEWCRQPFRDRDVFYKIYERNKSEIYRDTLPVLNSGKVRLLDHKTAVTQLCALERSARAGGRDIIDHPPGAHDDLANVIAGAIVLATQKRRRFDTLPPVSLPTYWIDGRMLPPLVPAGPAVAVPTNHLGGHVREAEQ